MKKKLTINKIAKKHIDGKCAICNEENYNLHDVHRIVAGKDGGKYTDFNTICCCSNCHRRIHAGEIIIDRKYTSTLGKTAIHYWRDNQEFWKILD